jgi:outer membrane protein TolC
MAKYVEQKVALKYEGLDVKAQLAKEEYNALQLRDSLATQKEQLNDLMGRDIRTEFSVSPVLEPTMVEVDLAAAQAHALEQRPDLKEAQLKIDQAEYDKRIKKLEYIPDISFAFSYLSPLSIEFVPKNIASVGILLSWDIFDWGRKRQELAEKTKSIEQANNGLRETQSQVLIDVDNKFRKLQETRDLMRVTQLAQEAAREKLRVTMNKYKENKALLKDLLEAQASLSEANNQYQQALSSFWTARADFEKALGKDE